MTDDLSRHDRSDLDPLQAALRELPRVNASPGLAERVVAARRTPRSVQPAWRLRFAVAAAALVVAILTAIHLDRRAREAERQDVLRRHAELRNELAELERRVSAPPTLYLATAGDFDVVLDLEPWIHTDSGRRTVRPAADRH